MRRHTQGTADPGRLAELSVPVPKVAAPSLKVTIPSGVPLPGATGLTVAVKVTDCPATDGWLRR